MKRILIVTDRQDTLGGLETHVLLQANELQKRGHKVTIYTNAIADFMKSLFHKDIEYITPWGHNPLEDIGGKTFDIVHSHPFGAITRGVEIANELNIPFVVTMHGLYNFGFDNSVLGQKVKNKIKKVLAVDNAVYNILKNSKNCPHEKLMMLPNGIDVDKFKAVSPNQKLFNKLKLNKKYKTLAIITRYDDSKEIPVLQLIKCLPKLSERLGGLNVVFVGGGQQLGKIENATNKIKCKNLNIVITGVVENVEKYINLADFICASAKTAIETISCNKNVFQMGIGKWGCLIDKNNYQSTLFDISYYTDYTDEELTNHIYWCLVQTDSIKQVTSGLCEIIRNLCDSNKIIDELEKIYNE